MARSRGPFHGVFAKIVFRMIATKNISGALGWQLYQKCFGRQELFWALGSRFIAMSVAGVTLFSA